VNTVSEFAVNTDRKPVDQMAVALPLWEAWDAPWEECLLEEAEGQIGADFIGSYPPGIPLLVPGERFSSTLIAYVQDAIRQGETLEGITQEIGEGGHVKPPIVHVIIE
jgi:arginine/lysine/ornithine decarboxylase